MKLPDGVTPEFLSQLANELSAKSKERNRYVGSGKIAHDLANIFESKDWNTFLSDYRKKKDDEFDRKLKLNRFPHRVLMLLWVEYFDRYETKEIFNSSIKSISFHSNQHMVREFVENKINNFNQKYDLYSRFGHRAILLHEKIPKLKPIELYVRVDDAIMNRLQCEHVIEFDNITDVLNNIIEYDHSEVNLQIDKHTISEVLTPNQ